MIYKWTKTGEFGLLFHIMSDVFQKKFYFPRDFKLYQEILINLFEIEDLTILF